MPILILSILAATASAAGPEQQSRLAEKSCRAEIAAVRSARTAERADIAIRNHVLCLARQGGALDVDGLLRDALEGNAWLRSSGVSKAVRDWTTPMDTSMPSTIAELEEYRSHLEKRILVCEANIETRHRSEAAKERLERLDAVLNLAQSVVGGQ